MTRRKLALFERSLLLPALLDALRKLSPRAQWRNPVMFVVYIGSLLTTLLWLQALLGAGEAPAWFIFNIRLWLWFTVLFANFAEALAEGRSKAQAAALRGSSSTRGPLALPGQREPPPRACAPRSSAAPPPAPCCVPRRELRRNWQTAP